MGGQGTLRVDYDELGDSARSLHGIKGEFEGIDDASEAVKKAVCSSDIAGAVEEFANNWDRHRGELVEVLGKLEQATRSAVATWQAVDRKVGRSIDTHGSGAAHTNHSPSRVVI